MSEKTLGAANRKRQKILQDEKVKQASLITSYLKSTIKTIFIWIYESAVRIHLAIRMTRLHHEFLLTEGQEMSVKSFAKHCVHCFLLMSIVFGFLYSQLTRADTVKYVEIVDSYGIISVLIFYALRIPFILSFPLLLSIIFGLVFFNAFPDDVKLKVPERSVPFICFRIVTRGDFPELVKTNLKKNFKACRKANLQRFIIQVVTEKPLGLLAQDKVRETVVPASYRTKSGALFKARNLQYCLENEVNFLEDNDWIVHLDEETVMTENAVRGIMNFTSEGKYQLGAGLITFGKDEIVNLFCTLADGLRTSDDMGRLRFELNIFHKPLSCLKGSFLVAQCKAEKQISFDHGIEGSVCEDIFFGRIAQRDGYSFHFVQGEMREQSPYTVRDFLIQRKRWGQGTILVILSSKIPFRTKFLLGLYSLGWLSSPLCITNTIVSILWPVSFSLVLDSIVSIYCGVYVYMFIFGVLKGIRYENFGAFNYFLCIIGAIAVAPCNAALELVTLVWGLFSDNKKFDVVWKENK